MPKFEKPETGTFCWPELQTKDPAAARNFYAALFDWKVEDMPMPGASYGIAKIGNNHVAGLMELPEVAAKMGTPPHWASYVAVDDVKATTDQAAKLGANVILGPTPMGPGTFSVIADPTGAVFLPWYTPQSMGTFLFGEPGALTWTELLTTNVNVALGFYTRLFGWTAEVMPGPDMPYTILKQKDVGFAGLMAQPRDMKGMPSVWTPYFSVADADAGLASATKLGAKALMPLMDVPDAGRFTYLQDPQGAMFAIIKTMPKRK